MALKRCFVFVFGFLVASAIGAEEVGNRREVTFPAGRVVLQPVNIRDAQALTIGYDSDGTQFVCSLSREDDLSLSIRREGVAEPLLRQNELPVGFAFTNAFVCRGDEVIFLAVQQVQGQAVTSVFAKRRGQVQRVLLSGESTFSAFDPRRGAIVQFTYWHTYFFSNVTSRFVVLAAASPPQTPGVPGIAQPQNMYLELPVGGGPPVVLFNNTTGQTPQGQATVFFSSQGDFCASKNSLYGLGQIPSPAPPTNSAVALYRIQNGQATLVKQYFELTGSGLKCTSDGVQVYEVLPSQNAVRYLYLADGSSSWRALFTGNQLDGTPIHSRDRQYPMGPDEVELLTNARHIVRVAGGEVQVLKLYSQNPRATPVDLLRVGERTLVVLNEGNVNRTHRMYRPRLVSDLVFGLPGREFVLRSLESVIENQLPMFSLQGYPDAVYSVSTDGTIRVTVPAMAPVGARIEGVVEVFGIQLPFTLEVGAPRPIVTAVTHGGNYRAIALAPGSHITLYLQNPGREATAFFGQALFELGGAKIYVGGKECRMYYNSGPLPNGSGQINCGLDQNLAPGEYELQVVVDGVAGDPVRVTIVDQSFALFQFPLAGQQIGIVTNQNYQLVGDPALGLMRLRNGDGIILWGTGAGATNPPVNDRQFAPAGPHRHRKPIVVLLDGQPLTTAYSGRAPGFASLDQVVVLLPAGTSPGEHTFTFGSVNYDIWVE